MRTLRADGAEQRLVEPQAARSLRAAHPGRARGAAHELLPFPSLQETLNHILLVDLFYIDALEAGGEGLAIFAQPLPFPTMAELVPAQRAADERLVRFCASLEASVLARAVEIDRGDEGISRESVEATLAHLFVHQIHHRGQTHAMLSGTRVPPPQLDEFFLEYDRARRAGEEIP